MDDDKQSQGTEEVKPEVAEKLAEMKQESETRAERAKTVSERLEKLTQSAETQPEPTPSSNQTTEPIASEEEKVALENSKNPERTAEYIEKLKAENQRLKEERRKAAGSSVFDALRPQEVPGIDMSQFGNLNPQTATQLTQDFIGPDGVDVDGLNKALKAANDRATIAEIEASRAIQKIQQFDENQQVREAHIAFPEIDPQSEKFDPNFYDLVALRVAKSGMKLTLAQAAEQVRQTYTPVSATANLDKVRDDAVNEYKNNLAKRDQQPFSTSQGEPRVVETSQELRDRTRKGDAYALDERLRKLGLIN